MLHRGRFDVDTVFVDAREAIEKTEQNEYVRGSRTGLVPSPESFSTLNNAGLVKTMREDRARMKGMEKAIFCGGFGEGPELDERVRKGLQRDQESRVALRATQGFARLTNRAVRAAC